MAALKHRCETQWFETAFTISQLLWPGVQVWLPGPRGWGFSQAFVKTRAGAGVTSEGATGKDVILSSLVFAGSLWLLQDDWREAAINSLPGASPQDTSQQSSWFYQRQQVRRAVKVTDWGNRISEVAFRHFYRLLFRRQEVRGSTHTHGEGTTPGRKARRRESQNSCPQDRKSPGKVARGLSALDPGGEG